MKRRIKEFNTDQRGEYQTGIFSADQLVRQFQGVFKEDVETYFKKAEAAIQEEQQKFYIYQNGRKNPSGGGRNVIVLAIETFQRPVWL